MISEKNKKNIISTLTATLLTCVDKNYIKFIYEIYINNRAESVAKTPRQKKNQIMFAILRSLNLTNKNDFY